MADGVGTGSTNIDSSGPQPGGPNGPGGNDAGRSQSPGDSGSARRRVFELLDPRRATASPSTVQAVLRSGAVVCVVAALLCVAIARSVVVKSTLPVALAAVAVVLWFRAGRSRSRVSTPPPSVRRNLVLTAEAIELEQHRSEGTTLPIALPLSNRFGLTLLSSKKRDRLVGAVTSEAGSILFATSFGAEERRMMADLLARSTVLGGDDQALDAAGLDGSPVQLGVREFREVIAELTQRSPDCADRIVLTDQHGHSLTLDGASLVAQGKRFDLSRALEWRPIVFQEQFGQAVTLYQGTWIRQGTSEVVLVSLLTPTIFDAPASDLGERTGSPELDVMAIRDQRLLQAAVADPPPNDQRVAMDRLFVVPLRAALDQAPRPSSSSSALRSRHPA